MIILIEILQIPTSHESDLDSFDTTMSVSWKELSDDA